MKPARRVKPSSAEFMAEGREAFLAGRYYLAAEAFAKARDADPRNPAVFFSLAGAKERIGEIDEAARCLTTALRLRPSWFEAAQRLAFLLERFRLEAPGELDPHGLFAAFAFDRIDRQAVAGAAIAHLRAGASLGAAILEAEQGGAEDAARSLVLRRTDKTLTQPLLHVALANSPNRDPGFERLLTALRRVLLLETPAERFGDKGLTGFVLALIRQCIENDYVWAASAEERRRLDELSVDWTALRGGDADQARRLMLSLLYAAPEDAIGDRLTADDCRGLRPKALGELLAQRLDEEAGQAEIAAAIPSLGVIEDGTSQRVARQYEAHPYPRWTSLQLPAEASAAHVLERFFTPERLAFLARPFKALIAGAGTGQHAITAAVRYGPAADVLAIDLSRRSLAYGKARAEGFGVANLRFAQADLMAIGAGNGPFDVIEAMGVLHHMAEPFKGWQALAGLLGPGGIMLIGLYSAVARRNIAELRSEAGYPGPSCDDDEARAYRVSLMNRPDVAAALGQSHDFYTLSDFRDLVLHEHERPIFLSEIEAFLDQHGLAFRGFNLLRPISEAFLKAFPEDRWPGRLGNWAVFEDQHPRIFDGMYQFWCEKTS